MEIQFRNKERMDPRNDVYCTVTMCTGMCMQLLYLLYDFSGTAPLTFT